MEKVLYCGLIDIFKDRNEQALQSSASDIDGLKQASSSRNTKKLTLSWMKVFNNWKITHSYTEEMLTYQPEDLNLILEKFYAELRKANGTDYGPTSLRFMMNYLDR